MRSLIAIAALLLAMPSQAQLTGLTLEQQCREEGTGLYLSCMAYFAGYEDASTVWRSISEELEQPLPMPCTAQVNR